MLNMQNMHIRKSKCSHNTLTLTKAVVNISNFNSWLPKLYKNFLQKSFKITGEEKYLFVSNQFFMDSGDSQWFQDFKNTIIFKKCNG